MDFIGLSRKISDLHTILLRKEILNKRQCINLLENIQKVVKTIQKISCNQQKCFLHPICGEVNGIVNKAKDCIEECCKEDWCHAVVMQVNNKEFFRELLFDLGYCFKTICDISQCCYPDQSEAIAKVEECTTFYPSSLDEVEEDHLSLHKRLQKYLDLHAIEHRALAQYLLGQVLALQKVEGGDLDNLVFPDEYPAPDYGKRPITMGQSGRSCAVFSTHWLGMKCATKVINVKGLEGEHDILKEAKLLRGLNNPNIIKLFCCGFDEHQKQIELVMEQGIMDLSNFLGENKDSLTNVVALDIMIQIASGMCYLHDMKVAHRDLKPANVLVIATTNSSSNNLGKVHVKLLDFGISKMEVKDYPEIPTGQGFYGTCGYTAPEAFENRSLEVDAFKTDVFGFGVECYEILSGERFFDGTLKNYLKFTHSPRPQLPEDCPQELKSLINDCWALEPVKRPKFLDIYNKLVLLKMAMLKKVFEERPTDLHEGFTSYINVKMNPKYWWTIFYGCLWQILALLRIFAIIHVSWLWFMVQLGRTNTPMSLQAVHEEVNKEVKIGLTKKIYELEKRLQTCGSLGIIGMGGVGKSTLACALSEHISHQFEAIIFVNDLTNERCTLLSKDTAKDLQGSAKVMTLMQGHKCIQEMQSTKQILIVLDDVGNQSQLQELLGNEVLDYGSKLIASSRDWKCLEQYVSEVGKIEMQTLDALESLNLFCMHAFAKNQPCLPYLTNVVAKIVRACGGLPLSLEVMGIYLQGEKRLRIWERTLQRLLRGRHDGNIDDRIWKTLRISFDELDDVTKDMFLDIACFFCKDIHLGGVSKETMCTIFSDNDDIARKTLERLIDKSLVKIGNDDRLDMHDQLRDMGRMIVEKEVKFKGTRMWNLHLSTFSACNTKDLEVVQGLHFTRLEQKLICTTNLKVTNMNKLRIMIINNCENVDLISMVLQQSTMLRWLRIQYSSTYSDSQQYICEISKFMRIGPHQLQQLRVLELEGCQFLKSFPNETFQVLPLKKIMLKNCSQLQELTSDLGYMSALVTLAIRNCGKLYKVSPAINKLTTLRELQLRHCNALEQFPSGLNNLVALEQLGFSHCKALRSIPEGLGGLTRLKTLEIRECWALEEFPSGLNNLVALTYLDFSKCKALRSIPEGLGGLTSLKTLKMSQCEALEELPSGLNNLVALTYLDFSKCKALRSIPEGLGGLTSLKTLKMSQCKALEELPLGLNNLVALTYLDFSKCKALRSISKGFNLGGLTSLKMLKMSRCEALEGFPSGLNNLVAKSNWVFRIVRL